MSTGVTPPEVLNSLTHSPTSYRLGRRTAPPSPLFGSAQQEAKFLSPSPTMTCSTAYCISAIETRDAPGERCSLGSLALVGLMTTSSPCATAHWPIHSPGKNTFLKFMLVRLISARQVVLLCKNSDVYLFYHGQVYHRLGEPGFNNLPECQSRSYYPIWTLIHAEPIQEPPVWGSSNIWPIQTSSPNPLRWDGWSRRYGAAVLGMPLWDMEELMEGYVFSFSSINLGCVV